MRKTDHGNPRENKTCCYCKLMKKQEKRRKTIGE